MSDDRHSVDIVVCHGTSCFARGNSENLAIVNQYLQDHGDRASLRLSGKLCQNQCAEGPNIVIGGTLHHGVTPARLRHLLHLLDEAPENGHGTD